MVQLYFPTEVVHTTGFCLCMERVQAHFFFSYIAVTTVLGLEEGKDCIIVGTLYKHMKLKPSILDEYAKEVK